MSFRRKRFPTIDPLAVLAAVVIIGTVVTLLISV